MDCGACPLRAAQPSGSRKNCWRRAVRRFGFRLGRGILARVLELVQPGVDAALRKKLRKKRGRPKKTSQPVVATVALVEAPRKSARRLEALEEQIDECMALAREVDREGLADVIALMRRARNKVVWQMGE